MTSPSSKDQMVVVVDTREQEPYGFDPSRVSTVRHALPAGDYSLAGCETRVAVERKSLDDYVSTVIRERERFARELETLRNYELACIAVEGSLGSILERRYRSGAHPNAVLGATLSIIVDHGIPVFFCDDRQIACRFVEGVLRRFHKKEQR